MVCEVLLLVDAEADAEADEQDDRGDAPDDAEHGEKAAELGLPECGQRLLENLAKRHRTGAAKNRACSLRYARMDSSGSLRITDAVSMGIEVCKRTQPGW